MSERFKIVENEAVNAEFEAEITSWGPLDEVDCHSSKNQAKYDGLVAFARERVGHSLAAAALVSAWDAHIERDPYNYGGNINAALDSAEQVKATQAFFEQHPTGEVGLYLGDYHLIMFKTDEAALATWYNSQHGHHAYLAVQAPFQTELSTYRGTLTTMLQVSDRGETGRRGGYQYFSVGFNDMQKPNQPLVGHFADPLIMGRDAIQKQFEWSALKESMEGVTSHRHLSLAHALWRLRTEDPSLTETVHRTSEHYGLVDVWQGQFRQEIGAKAAHVIVAGALEMPPRDIPYREAIHLQAPFLSDEPELFGGDIAVYLPAAQRQAKRLGLAADDALLHRAVDYVFKR